MKISHISRYEMKQSILHYSIIYGGGSTFRKQFTNQYECELTFHHGLLSEIMNVTL